MNAYDAYELADRVAELERLAESTRKAFTNVSAANLELTKEADKWCLKWHEACERIAELETFWKDCEEDRTQKCSDCQKQSEPVAYVNWNTGTEISMDFLPAVLFDKFIIENKQDYIPLYTTPQTKPLSDAEIEKIENRIYCKTTAKGKSPYEYATQLARAIEAKVRGQ